MAETSPAPRRGMSTGQRFVLVLPILGAAAALAAMLYAATAGLGGTDPADLPGLILFVVWNLLPYAGVAVSMILVARFAPRAWPLLVVGSIALVGFGVWAAIGILRSESSTAAIGFVFIPLALWLSLGVLMAAVLIVHLVANRLAEERPR